MATRLWSFVIDRITIQWRLATGTNLEREQSVVRGASAAIDLTNDQVDGNAADVGNDPEIAYVNEEKLAPFVQAQQRETASSIWTI